MQTRKMIVGIFVVLVTAACFAEARVRSVGRAVENAKSLSDSVRAKTRVRGPKGVKVEKTPRLRRTGDGYLCFAGAAPYTHFTVDVGRAAEPKEVANAFLQKNRDLFVNRSDKIAFDVKRVKTRGSKTFVRYQQTYSGLDVFGAEVIVQVNADSGVDCALSDIMRDSSLLVSGKVSLVPSIDSSAAEDAAVKWMAEQHKGLEFEATPATLMIYEPLVVGPDGPTQLVWQSEVGNAGEQHVRENVFVNAHTGKVVFHYPLIYDALYRIVCDDTECRYEGDPPTDNNEIDNAYDYLGATYNFYKTEHNRDSIDNYGMTAVANVGYSVCNAAWSPGNKEMYFGNGLTFDDVVAHEYTHGVTQHESNLIYSYQSGAINESFSDMWGEWVDLSYTNGNDTDTNEVRWLMGEDVDCTGGAIRDMQNPPNFNHPDKMSSEYWYSGSGDNGGVHTNSGVGNKLCYLLTDGDTFNGYTVSGMGMSKTADLMYECQAYLLTSASQYADLGDALVQAAMNFLEDGEINALECYNVVKACSAVEIYDESTTVTFYKDYYNCNSNVGILLADPDLLGESTQDVNVNTSGGDFEVVTLTAASPNDYIFTGSIWTDSGDPNSGDGTLQVSHGDMITVTYYDANDGNGVPAEVNDTAGIDCVPPVISNIEYDGVVILPPGVQTITFETDEDTYAKVTYGTTCGDPNNLEADDGVFSTEHSIELKGLSLRTQYYFEIEVSDRANVVVDNNGGNCYDFFTYPKDICVPGDFNTIQEAVDDSYDGCIVWVATGTYSGAGNRNIDFLGKAITVSSTDPKDPNVVASTIIDCDGSRGSPRCGFIFDSGEDANSVLEGFTIIDGYGQYVAFEGGYFGGAIFCKGSSPTIQRCVLSDNMNDKVNNNTFGGAIGCYDDADPLIENCIIYDNEAYQGGAISVIVDCQPTIRNCLIYDNEAVYGGGILEGGGSVEVLNCTIVNNSATTGGGVYSYNGSETITNCILWNNGDDLYNCSATYSCIEDNDSGQGNIHDDPCFINSGGDDFHLRGNSPCINAGDPSGNYDGQLDIDNDPRVRGGEVDIGADEAGNVYNVNKVKWYEKIQTAIGLASNNDEIVVFPGTYRENICYSSKVVNLHSSEPNEPNATIINGAGSSGNYAVKFDGGHDYQYAILNGFTIKNGAGGIYNYCGNPKISNCIIENYSGEDKHGIFDTGGPGPAMIVENSIIRNNYYGVRLECGGATVANNQIYGNNRGIYSSSGTTATIEDNQIYDNQNGISVFYGNVTIQNNWIYDNGTGIETGGGQTATVKGNQIYGNGNGIDTGSGSAATIENNWIYDNTIEGIYSDGPVTIRNNLVYRNYEGMYISNSNAAISNNTIVYNTDNGIKYRDIDWLTIYNCIVWGNGDNDFFNCSLAYSCIEDCNDVNETNYNICADPCFVDADSNDFHIDIHSPCVNRGNPSGDYDDQVDIDGEPRVIGLYVDMGADEVNVPVSDAHQWGLDERSGTTAYDSVDDDDGTYSAGTPSWVDGLIGGAVDFNDTSNYFSVSSLDNEYSNSDTFTVAGWFKTSETSGLQTIVGQWSQMWEAGQEYFGWQVLVENNKVIARFGYGTTSDITGTKTVTGGGWHHFAMVRNGTNVALYVNGQPEDSGTANFYALNTKFRIGDGSYKFNGNPALKGGPFEGTIDEVMIFDGALSAGEIEDLYDIGAPD